MAGYVTVELFSSDGDLLLETQVSPDVLEHAHKLDPERLAEFSENFADGVRKGAAAAEHVHESSE